MLARTGGSFGSCLPFFLAEVIQSCCNSSMAVDFRVMLQEYVYSDTNPWSVETFAPVIGGRHGMFAG